MTTKKELLAEIAELLAKVAELQAQVDAMPDELRIETARAYEPLALRKGYFTTYAGGAIASWAWNDDTIDKNSLKNGQIFLTEEAAQREIKRRQLWHQCRKAMKEAWEAFGEAPYWSNRSQEKYCIDTDFQKVYFAELFASYKRIHFPTKESLNAWRSTVTDDDIKLMLIEEW